MTCLRTSSLARWCRVKRTLAASSPVDLSTVSRSTVKSDGHSSGVGASSHWVMAAWGEVTVWINETDKPPITFISADMTSSALPWLPALSTKRRFSKSIHTSTVDWRAKACGSSDSSTSSISSRFSFLPGLRPVAASISAMRSSALRRTTLPGTALDSIMSFMIHCPATDSTKGPWASPLGGTQPIDLSWLAPHSTNCTGSNAACTSAKVGAKPSPMR